jgi:hypothetical protein
MRAKGITPVRSRTWGEGVAVALPVSINGGRLLQPRTQLIVDHLFSQLGEELPWRLLRTGSLSIDVVRVDNNHGEE